MMKREELADPSSCMSRAREDEMTFVLLGRDAAAPVAIRAWIAERIRLGKNQPDDAQITEAYTCAERMDAERAAVPATDSTEGDGLAGDAPNPPSNEQDGVKGPSLPEDPCMTELEHVRAEFERYLEAAHKAGVVFSVGTDGVRAEYNPALAKCVASWDADGEIEQPMPDKANEHALTTSQDSQAKTTAGKPSPTALPAVDAAVIEWMEPRPELPTSWPGVQVSSGGWWRLVWQIGVGMRWYPNRPLTLDALREVEGRLSKEQWEDYWGMSEAAGWFPYGHTDPNPSEMFRAAVHATAEQKIKALAAVIRASAPDSTPPRRDGLAGDVQPLRPRE